MEAGGDRLGEVGQETDVEPAATRLAAAMLDDGRDLADGMRALGAIADVNSETLVLARILEVGGTQYHPINQEHDLEWSRYLTLHIAPRSELTDGRRRIAELEYGMIDGRLEIPIRLSG